MCIAEALLRIPDDATADRLIAEQLATGDWSSHAGRSESLFVNASTWGLMLTGGMLELDPDIKTRCRGMDPPVQAQGGRAAGAARGAPRDAHHRRRVRGRPQHRGGAWRAARASPRWRLCSFDMLGEGARTMADAERYLASYEHAIDVIGAPVAGRPAHRALEHLDQIVGLGAALYAAAARARDGAPGAQGARTRPARGEARHPAHHRCRRGRPAGSVARCDRGAGARRRDARLAGPGARRAGVFANARWMSSSGWLRPRGRMRQAHDGSAGQGRLLGQRDQARTRARTRRAIRSTPARSPPTFRTSRVRAGCSGMPM